MILSETVITSRQNPLILWAASLSDKKYRDKEQVFIADGAKLLWEAAETGMPIVRVFIAESRVDAYITKIREKLDCKQYDSLPVTVISDTCFDKISSEKAPQGVITVIKYLDFFKKSIIINCNDFEKDERAIMCYAMRDPGNLGSVIRSAVAFGADRIIVSADSADPYNPKTVRSAMGSLFRVKISECEDMEGTVAVLRGSGRRVLAAELTDNAVSLTDAALLPSDIVMIGNEGHGIPASLSEKCNGSVYIPISKATESLNASVAAALFMWEQNRR